MKKSTQSKRSKADEQAGMKKPVKARRQDGGKARNRVGVTGSRITKAQRAANEKRKIAPQKKKTVRVKKKTANERLRVKAKAARKKMDDAGLGDLADGIEQAVDAAAEVVAKKLRDKKNRSSSSSDEKKPAAKKRKRRGAKKRKVRNDKGSTRLTRVDAFKRIKDLPNYDEVHHKIVSNVSPQSIARWIQDDCGLCEDITSASLVATLYRYKRSIPYEERTPKEMTAIARRVEQFPHELSVLEETTRLYEIQTTRVAQLIDIEDDAGEPLRALGVEMDRGMKYLQQIAELKAKLGLIGDHGEQRSAMDFGDTMMSGAMAVIQKKYGDGATQKLAFIGKKIHEALQQITLADGKRITGRQNPVTTLVGETESGVEVHEKAPVRPDRPEDPQPGPGEGVVPPAPDLPTEGDSLA